MGLFKIGNRLRGVAIDKRWCLISNQACEILKKLFPDWVPLSTNEDPCAVCEAYIHNSKEDKRELRKKAEDEKVSMIRRILGTASKCSSIS